MCQMRDLKYWPKDLNASLLFVFSDPTFLLTVLSSIHMKKYSIHDSLAQNKFTKQEGKTMKIYLSHVFLFADFCKNMHSMACYISQMYKPFHTPLY